MHLKFHRIFSSKARVVWIVILITIPLLSIYGRPVQRFLQGKISSTQLATLFLLSSILFLGVLARSVIRHRKKHLIIHLAWAVLLFLALPYTLPTVVERLHFIVFGLFGFFSVFCFGLLPGIIFGLSVGGLDELLQWVLPDRVGDWRDIGFNWLACVGGCLLAYFLVPERENNHQHDR